MLPEPVLLQGGHFGEAHPVELGLVPSPNLLSGFFASCQFTQLIPIYPLFEMRIL